MTRDDIRQALYEIMQNVLPEEKIVNLKDDVPIRNQTAMDSMDFLEVILSLRKKYKINIPEIDYDHFKTMNSTIAYLEGKIKGKTKDDEDD